jgi:hypothetical protein
VQFSKAASDVSTVQIAAVYFSDGVTKLQEKFLLLAHLALCTDASTLDFLIYALYTNNFCRKTSEYL